MKRLIYLFIVPREIERGQISRAKLGFCLEHKKAPPNW